MGASPSRTRYLPLCRRRCVTDKVLGNIGSTESLTGFTELKADDQELVVEAFEKGSVTETAAGAGGAAESVSAACLSEKCATWTGG